MKEMKMAKAMLILSLIANLFSGCKSPLKPEILDGPGMVYIDSEYRTDYANAVGYKDEDTHMCVAGFLGHGDEGEKNATLIPKKLFASLTEEERIAIKTVLYDGDEWYLFVPRYRDDTVWIEYLDKDGAQIKETQMISGGTPFVLRCNPSDTQSFIHISGRMRGWEFDFSPETDDEGNLVTENYEEKDVCLLTDFTTKLKEK